MIAKETSSIANLINEDANFCSSSYPQQDHEISSWSIEPLKTHQKRPSRKLYFTSLPPITSKKQTFLSQESNTSASLSSIPNLPLVQKSSKKEDKREKVKVTELKSLESYTERTIDPPTKTKFQAFHPQKIRSLKKTEKSELHSSFKFRKSFFPSEFSTVQKVKKQPKMIIGLVYPMKFYEKYFNVNETLQCVKTKGNQVDAIQMSRNEEYKEIIKKVTGPGLRSHSMFAENFFEKITNRNKYLLHPL